MLARNIRKRSTSFLQINCRLSHAAYTCSTLLWLVQWSSKENKLESVETERVVKKKGTIVKSQRIYLRARVCKYLRDIGMRVALVLKDGQASKL